MIIWNKYIFFALVQILRSIYIFVNYQGVLDWLAAPLETLMGMIQAWNDVLLLGIAAWGTFGLR